MYTDCVCIAFIERLIYIHSNSATETTRSKKKSIKYSNKSIRVSSALSLSPLFVWSQYSIETFNHDSAKL